jgi:hypothetical protein
MKMALCTVVYTLFLTIRLGTPRRKYECQSIVVSVRSSPIGGAKTAPMHATWTQPRLRRRLTNPRRLVLKL